MDIKNIQDKTIDELQADNEWLEHDVELELSSIYERIRDVFLKNKIFTEYEMDSLDIEINIDDPYAEKKYNKRREGLSIRINSCEILYRPFGFGSDIDEREDRGVDNDMILKKKKIKDDKLFMKPVHFHQQDKIALKKNIKLLNSMRHIIMDIEKHRSMYLVPLINCESFQMELTENNDQIKELKRKEKLKTYAPEIELLRSKVFNFTPKESQKIYDDLLDNLNHSDPAYNSTGKTLNQMKIEGDGSIYFERYHIKMHRDKEGELHQRIQKGYNGKQKKIKTETLVQFIGECNYYTEDIRRMANKYGKKKKREDRKIHIYDLMEKLNERLEQKEQHKKKPTLTEKVVRRFKQ